MKAGVVIETIKTIKNTAAKKQMYKLCWNLRTIEEELKSLKAQYLEIEDSSSSSAVEIFNKIQINFLYFFIV